MFGRSSNGHICQTVCVRPYCRSWGSPQLLQPLEFGTFRIFSIYAFPPATCLVALVLTNPSDNAGAVKRCEFDPWVRKIPWRAAVAIHFSILAWRIPCTEEPGWLQVHRVAGVKTRLKQLSMHWDNVLISSESIWEKEGERRVLGVGRERKGKVLFHTACMWKLYGVCRGQRILLHTWLLGDLSECFCSLFCSGEEILQSHLICICLEVRLFELFVQIPKIHYF